MTPGLPEQAASTASAGKIGLLLIRVDYFAGLYFVSDLFMHDINMRTYVILTDDLCRLLIISYIPAMRNLLKRQFAGIENSTVSSSNAAEISARKTIRIIQILPGFTGDFFFLLVDVNHPCPITSSYKFLVTRPGIEPGFEL